MSIVLKNQLIHSNQMKMITSPQEVVQSAEITFHKTKVTSSNPPSCVDMSKKKMKMITIMSIGSITVSK
jgi:hypothetical protein